MDRMQQDELALLFARNLNFSNQQHPQPGSLPTYEKAQQAQETLPLKEPITYVSQHYVHTAHIGPRAASESLFSPSPSTALLDDEVEKTFHQNSIDPHALLPSQLRLFCHAGYEQRLRLLELWRISPPEYGSGLLAKQPSESWLETSIELEEEAARLRYEMRMKEREQDTHQTQAQQDSSMEGIEVQPQAYFPPPARIRAASILNGQTQSRNAALAEPYMASGYETLAQREYEQQVQSQRQATDPVYAVAAGLWQMPSYSQQSMEDRYGAWQMQQGGPQYVGMHGHVDEEMVM
ncbi:hypothetical protein LTR66_010152 [Elasticomyces elasticus]|nr:hypothetical protein LTR66_010152 [Elasticomyces elasticus]